MRAQIKLGKIAGIAIGLHYSWFIIAILIAMSLVAHFRAVDPGWSYATVGVAAVVTAVLFFVALLLHELAHSMVAKSRGLRVRAITLFALGGVSQIESEAPNAKSEFWIAIVGPITSLVIGAICIAIVQVIGWKPGTEAPTPVLAVLLWLGYINVALAAFNMIPGYPLDGGRVLRSIIWWGTGNMRRATHAAARVGQVTAILFIVYGIYRFFLGANFGGLWIAFIGWFLLDAARSSYIQVEIMTDLRGRTVADMMERECTRVEGFTNVRDFVDHYLVHTNSRCFPVMRDGNTIGMLTIDQVRSVPRRDWDLTSLQSIMRPLSEFRTVAPDAPAVETLELLAREGLDQVLVTSEGKLQGIFSRNQVMRFLQIHSGQNVGPRLAA